MIRSVELTDINVAIVFGGPSPERDISLDSARTFYDAVRFLVDPTQISIIMIELDGSLSIIDSSWIYCNTIEDILLSRPGSAGGMNFKDVARFLEEKSAVFLFVHGEYGEDGRFEELLRSNNCNTPILGSSAVAQRSLYDKEQTYEKLRNFGYPTIERVVITKGDGDLDAAQAFTSKYDKIVVKPCKGGSSDGVSLATRLTVPSAIEAAFRFDNKILLESFIHGREFSVIVLQDTDEQAFALLPTQIRVLDQLNPIYTRLKKYMPGSGASHQTPASFSDEETGRIRSEAADIFSKFGLSDFARFDGFLLEDGSVLWSDLNGVPGFGMDSLLFQQSSLFGLDQVGMSYFLLEKCLRKAGLSIADKIKSAEQATSIYVLGGGETSERQVSRMSWLNVIQKLTYTRHFNVHAVFVDKSGDMYEVPPFVTLQHTVEEIEEAVVAPGPYVSAGEQAQALLKSCKGLLGSMPSPIAQFSPKPIDFKQIAESGASAFLALHGGPGEDGTYQAEFDRLGISYNGSGPKASALCMNKHLTAKALNEMKIEGFRGPNNLVADLCDFQLPPDRDKGEIAADIGRGMSITSLSIKHKLDVFSQELGGAVNRWREALNSKRGLVF